MTDQVQPAVMPEFSDAAGLEALAAAGGRTVPSNARSHGDAPKGATPPAASIPWPPPKMPDQFAQLVHQVDGIGAAVADIFGLPVEPLPETVTKETAEGIWPLAYFYGAGGDRPTKGVLFTYAALSVAGLVLLHVAQIKAARDKALAERKKGAGE